MKIENGRPVIDDGDRLAILQVLADLATLYQYRQHEVVIADKLSLAVHAVNDVYEECYGPRQN